MSFNQTFSSPRKDSPDPVALLNLIRGFDSTASGGESFPGNYVVKKSTPFSSQDLINFQNIIDTAPSRTARTDAQNIINNMPIFEKAILLALLDQINVLRTRAGLATISVAQAIQGVKDKAGTL